MNILFSIQKCKQKIIEYICIYFKNKFKEIIIYNINILHKQIG